MSVDFRLAIVAVLALCHCACALMPDDTAAPDPNAGIAESTELVQRDLVDFITVLNTSTGPIADRLRRQTVDQLLSEPSTANQLRFAVALSQPVAAHKRHEYQAILQRALGEPTIPENLRTFARKTIGSTRGANETRTRGESLTR